MGRSRSFHMPQKLKPYDKQPLGPMLGHTSVANKKWWFGFSCAALGILLLMYMPVYHQLQTRIGENNAQELVTRELVGTHCLFAESKS